jgi:hypothetical protein
VESRPGERYIALKETEMIREVQGARQIRSEGFRRWFTDQYFDLIVWYEGVDAQSPIAGFQLCYDKAAKERALTWRRDRGFTHEKVDDGEWGRTLSAKMTPILVPDGLFDASAITRQLREHSTEMDPGVATFVLTTLAGYGQAL